MRVLVLAGTSEARALCAQLAGIDVLDAHASLAGVTSDPKTYALPVRIGGFGGAEGLAQFLESEEYGALIDATHPFASVMSENASRASEMTGIPLLRLARAPWVVDPSWQMVNSVSEALVFLPEDSTAFLATGRKTLDHLHAFRGQRSYLRVVDEQTDLYPGHGEFVIYQSPTVETEQVLFEKLDISHLVAKNSGGAKGHAKIDAAMKMNLQIVMVARPQLAPAIEVSTPQEALDWLRAVAGRT